MRQLSLESGNAVRRIEELSGASSPSLGRALMIELVDHLPWPRWDSSEVPSDSDVAVDVALHGYRLGSATDVSLGAMGLPLMWRPSVRLGATLYRRGSSQPVGSFLVIERIPWSAYLRRAMSWRVWAGLEAPGRRQDLDGLLRGAAERLVGRVQDAA
ncbi:hypothetical protein AACH06_29025 [Ideonella sp. DXS29W]|uniref:PilZ domain-containing protein n=1 Tax=Ideonella lacteola TaxID=2984193 RepID=A0ABU9BZJ9_9BURK